MALGVPLVILAAVAGVVAGTAYFFGYGFWTAAVAVLKMADDHGAHCES
jgi:hypothetical protein